MADLKISELMELQRALWERHRDTWAPMEPQYGRDFVLYMIEEIGECVAVIKKKGDRAIMEQPQVREHFVEEMSDVLMYFTDTLLRYGVSPEEFSEAYLRKHAQDLGRDYGAEYGKL